MPTSAHTPTCVHCGYNLADLPPNEQDPHLATCPECRKQSDITQVPAPISPWWRMPVAALAGAATTMVGFVLFNSLVFGGLRRWPNGTGPLAILFCVLLGGVVSIAIIWRDRIAFLEWDERSKRIPARTRWFLLIDFVFYCILNCFLIWAILSGVTAFFR